MANPGSGKRLVSSGVGAKSLSKLRHFFNRGLTISDALPACEHHAPQVQSSEIPIHKSLEPISSDDVPIREHYAPQVESSETYVYDPLGPNKIRIFWMQLSSRVEDEIVGTLEIVDMGEPRAFPQDKEYTALSYAWGPTYEDGSHLTETIICDGCTMRVTSNIKQALRRIRAHGSMELTRMQQKDRPGNRLDGMNPLWIDAICINQDDLQERNAQVQMMGRIFTECLSLIIWLGEPDKGMLGIEQCEILRKLCTVSNGEQYELGMYPLPGYPKAGERLHSILDSILTRPWFSRRWVIQECAPRGITGWIMLGAANCHRDLFTALLEREHLMDMAKPLQMPRRSRSIFQTLYTYDSSQCEDARDRVFALKELSWDGKHIQVDYNQDVRNTYLNVARRIVFGVTDGDDFGTQFFRNGPQVLRGAISDGVSVPDALRMLAVASCKKSIVDETDELRMESWLPDWRIPTEFESIQHEWAVQTCHCDADEAKCIVLCDIRHQILIDRNGYNYYATEGIIVANHPPSRSTTSQVSLSDPEQVELNTKLQCWAESVRKRLNSHCQDQETEADLIWLTLAGWMITERFERRMLAFIIRPSQGRSTFRDMPVYRLISCLMTDVMPAIPTVESVTWEEESNVTPRAAWQTLAKSNPYLSWQAFCLE